MKLYDLLVALAGNAATNITLIDAEGENLITFNAAGYASIENDLGEREVKKIKVDSQSSVSITIKDAPEATEPASDPSGDP